MVWGNAESSLGGARDRAPAAIRFSCILQTPDDSFWKMLGGGVQVREAIAPIGPLKSACGVASAAHWILAVLVLLVWWIMGLRFC